MMVPGGGTVKTASTTYRDFGVDRIGRDWVSAGEPGLRSYYRRRLLPVHSTRQRLGLWTNRWTLLPQSRWSEEHPEHSDEKKVDWPPEAVAVLSDMAGDHLNLPNVRIRSIVLHGHGSKDRFVVLLFPPQGRSPLAVMKIAPQESSELSREKEMISRLRRRLDGDLLQSVPEAQTLLEFEQYRALVLAPVAGTPAYVEVLRAWRPGSIADRHLGGAASWLGRFHSVTSDPSEPLAVETLEEELIDASRRARPGTDRLPRWGAELLEQWSTTRPVATATHRDFWSRNLLMRDDLDRLPAVVDWADSEERGDFTEDLCHFPLTYGLNFPWSRRRRLPLAEAFRRTFIDKNQVSSAVRRYVSEYCRITGLAFEMMGPLFCLHLYRRATRVGSPERLDLEPSGVSKAHWSEFLELLSCAEESVFSG